MLVRLRILLSLVLLFASLSIANDKKKNMLPISVLRARTVLVVVDPNAGMSTADPLANRTAKEDVEKAIMKWGRLTPVMEPQTADLIITIRKGHGRIVEPTIGSGRGNDPSVVLQPNDGGIRIGGKKGPTPDLTNPPPGGPQDTRPQPGAEIGSSDDMFVVYQGGVEHPLDSSPIWRYVSKDALRSPGVPAVAEFRKLIEQAEKQQKGKP